MENIVPQSVPLKQCKGPCGKYFPATTAYFHSNGNKHLRPYCKTCRNAQKKVLGSTPEGKAKMRDRNKAWQETHKEEKVIYQKQYWQSNKEHLSQYGKEYHQAHKEMRNKRDRLYHQTHREQRNAHQRAYSRSRPLQNRMFNQKRRAIRKAVVGTLTHGQIQEKLKKQHYACYYCFVKFEKQSGKYVYQLDHTIPVSRAEAGPRHDVNYVVLACPTCNNKKKAKLPHEWPEGGRLF